MTAKMRPWNSVSALPPADVPIEVRFHDGSFDLALWTGEAWFPAHPGKTAIAWRILPEEMEQDRVA